MMSGLSVCLVDSIIVSNFQVKNELILENSNFWTVEYEYSNSAVFPNDYNPNISEIKAFPGNLSKKSSQPSEKKI